MWQIPGRTSGRRGDRWEDWNCQIYLRADGAHDVELNLWGMKSYPMEEGEDGWWTAEVTGIEKGFHYYNYIVNSANTVDCNAPVGYGGFQAVNYLEMPEEDFEEYRIRQVPHGTVHYEYYKSNSTGRTKLCYVYTPAGYEEHLENDILFSIYNMGAARMRLAGSGRESLPISRIT